MDTELKQMIDFDPWLSSIRSKPKEWLAPLIRSGRPDIALDLLRDNPHLLSAQLSRNETPLFLAACGRHHDLVEYLLTTGVRITFIVAVVLSRISTVRAMLDTDPRLALSHSPSRIGAIHLATAYADTAMLELLLSAGASIHDHRNSGRLTPLFVAHTRHENARLLLSKGADINARAKNGFTPLHHAARNGDRPFVDFLLANGARLDLQTDGRQTPWALAVRHRHHDIAAIL